MKSSPFIYLLNIFGLGTGIAAFFFIAVYAQHEYSYDTFHRDADRIYRVNHVIKREGQDPYFGAATFPRVGPALKEEFVQIEDACRLLEVYFGGIGVVNNKPIEHDRIYYADESFFEFFSFPLLHGEKSQVLSNVNTAVLSSETAFQHFGTIDCIGKIISIKSIEGDQNYEVTGVYDNSNPSHIQADIILSFSSYLNLVGKEVDTYWNWFDFVTYVKLDVGTDLRELDKSFVEFVDKHGGERSGSKLMDLDLIPLKDIHLKSNVNQEISKNGDGQAVNFLLIIGIFIILIAWVNYVNLYTARATDRSKEVGIRKTLGSSKLDLMSQFFVEAAFVNLLSVITGLAGFVLLKKFAFEYLGISLPALIELLLVLGGLSIGILLVSVLFSGSYPAIFISNFKILTAIKGGAPQSGNGRFRKILVVFQFMASGFMIGGTLLVIYQLNYMNSIPIGADTSNTVVIEVTDYSNNNDRHVRALNTMKESFERFSGVHEVSYSSDVPGAQVAWRGSSWLMNDQTERKLVHKMTVEQKYLEFLKLEFIAGRNFAGPNDSLSVVINEEAMRFYGFESAESAINQRVRFAGLDTLRIIGVVNNYYQESLKEAFKPTAYFLIRQELRFLSVRLDNSGLTSFLKFAENQFAETFPEIPFVYHTMENLLSIRHKKEETFTRLFNAFSALAIFISFLGLLGLAFYTVNKRRKEAGIRKVLGSSVFSIVRLLFSDFARLVIIGNLVAIPALVVLGNSWLNQFTFHVKFSWLIPVLTLALSLLFAFAFTLFHLMKLGRVNPVEVLKDE
ncbi:MAG: ABC transporter permease [Cyclobacteriaceae bacterium]